jgi:hypothetical protein
MKTIFASTGLVALMLLAAPATQAAASKTLWPTQQDRAICDPIFARLQQAEQGTRMAQADTGTAVKPAQDKPPETKPDEDKLATQLSAMLQACSYDGKAIEVDPQALKTAAGPEAVEAVRTIMRFTGLPQNFRIVEGHVPNAAAMIVLGPDGIAQRVIAYNRQFVERLRLVSAGSDWPAISIMAHEIGHHLSGHTLMPGGSQPPIELEADKFSGFVLFKMGAALPDAERAIATLVPEADGPTHPGRKRRLAAVEAGWTDSCRQQQEVCGGSETARPAPPAADIAVAQAQPPQPQVKPSQSPQTQAQGKPQPPEPQQNTQPHPPTSQSSPSQPPSTQLQPPGTRQSRSQDQPPLVAGEPPVVPLPDIPGAADITIPKLNKDGSTQGSAVRTASRDRLPRLDAIATPSKFDRFVYDEVGVFDPAVKDKLAATAFQFAAATQVEVVTIVAADLQGRSPDQYALDVLRQLRVGKLDVGNGAVLVVAPGTREIGAALGPGLLVQYDTVAPLKNYLKGFLDVVAGGGRPESASGLIANASYRVMRDTKALEWVVRYNSLEAMLATAEKARTELARSGAAYDPAKDPTWRKLLRIDATVISKNPDPANRKLAINAPKTRDIGPALHVRTAGGQDAVLYVSPNVPALMPVALEEGKRYAFIARDSFLAGDTPQFDLISYDRLD